MAIPSATLLVGANASGAARQYELAAIPSNTAAQVHARSSGMFWESSTRGPSRSGGQRHRSEGRLNRRPGLKRHR